MKHIALIFLTISILNNIQAQEPSDKIVGSWFNEDKTSKIEIYETSKSYNSKIVWLAELEKNPERKLTDKNNPNPKLRNRNILGMDIITGLEYSGGKWVNGTIYTPKRGIYADCEVVLLSNGKLKMIVSKSGIKRTQIWTRK